ncbi:hypothetical protein GCM10023224_11660 [Streptomonospora halophila]|uniref:Uncharacterized protein n=1 Tax=Streptomonospora halophila TaxID=427369 RepID=A0ABP9G8L6_9ACTN
MAAVPDVYDPKGAHPRGPTIPSPQPRGRSAPTDRSGRCRRPHRAADTAAPSGGSERRPPGPPGPGRRPPRLTRRRRRDRSRMSAAARPFGPGHAHAAARRPPATDP